MFYSVLFFVLAKCAESGWRLREGLGEMDDCVEVKRAMFLIEG